MISCLVVGYFLADFKIQDKTIKQHIDEFLASDQAKEIKNDIQKKINDKIKSNSSDQEEKKPQQKPEPKALKKTNDEGITSKDRDDLKEILRENEE